MEKFPGILPNIETLEENQVEKPEIKEGINFVFEQHPELQKIGTKEQYSEYLYNIFPDSTFKEIVYHNSDADFRDEGFKPMNPNFDTLNSIIGIYNFSSNREFAKRYGKNTYAVILNIHRPIEETTSGEYADDMDGPLSEALFRIGKQTNDNLFAPKYDETLVDSDAVINYISGEGYIAKHPVSGGEMGIPHQTVLSVFNENQIHILGSKSDIERFKEFVRSE